MRRTWIEDAVATLAADRCRAQRHAGLSQAAFTPLSRRTP